MCWHNPTCTLPVFKKYKRYFNNAIAVVLVCLSSKLTDALSNGTLTETTWLMAKADAKKNTTEGIMGSEC